MSKLRENIDRILGNSLRCLLPSYWWKRIFGLLVEEIDDVRSTANSKANKSEVASLSNSVDALSDKVDKIDNGNNITVDSSLSTTSTNPVQNKVIKAYVDDKLNDLTEEIITNEEVHAAALNDLNARIKELEERLNSAGL